MKLSPEKSCNCTNIEPVIFHGALSESPLKCMQCKKPILLENNNISVKFSNKINEWWKAYKSLITLTQGSTEDRECAIQKLLDDIDPINLQGLTFAQQLNTERKTYFWMFQDNNDKNYTQPRLCPFCGALMEPILNNDFKVCHDCMIAYPDKCTC
jgi:hypothetical protein